MIMFQPLARYADFTGRARRTEYWGWTLLLWTLGVLLLLFIGFTAPSPEAERLGVASPLPWIGTLVLIVLMFAAFIPNLAVSVRRLHDQDKSGWFLLLSFVPLGGLILLLMMTFAGTKGPNRFGNDPRNQGQAEIFA